MLEPTTHGVSANNIVAISGLGISFFLDGLKMKAFNHYSKMTLGCNAISNAEIYQLGQIHFLWKNYEEAAHLYIQAPIGPQYSETWNDEDIYREFWI